MRVWLIVNTQQYNLILRWVHNRMIHNSIDFTSRLVWIKLIMNCTWFAYSDENKHRKYYVCDQFENVFKHWTRAATCICVVEKFRWFRITWNSRACKNITARLNSSSELPLFNKIHLCTLVQMYYRYIKAIEADQLRTNFDAFTHYFFWNK